MRSTLLMAALFVTSSTLTAQDKAAPKPAKAPAKTAAKAPAAKAPPKTAPVPADVRWIDAQELTLEGKAWADTNNPYDRLPARAEKTVPTPVWSLSKHSAGMAVRFIAETPALYARWTVVNPTLGMTHMPASAVSGLDLYARDDDGQWRWVANPRPAAQTTEMTVFSGVPVKQREYLLYLPLYNGVTKLEVGVPPTAKLEKGPARPAGKQKPLLFWGTSITHGASASRPGMCHPAIIGRRFDRPVINLGFSGNGKMDAPVTQLIAELDPEVFIIDCCPNMTADLITERTEPLVRTLREKHPDTPILLVEDRNYGDAWFLPSRRERNVTDQQALKAAYKRLTDSGVKNLYYLTAEELLPGENDATVDGSHPTDLGFWRQADAFEKVLKKILK